MLDKEIFDDTGESNQTNAKTEIGDGKNPSMDVSNYSSIISEESESNNSIQIDPSSTNIETSIPDSNNNSKAIAEESDMMETSPPPESVKLSTQNTSTVTGNESNNEFPIETLESSPDNSIPESTTETKQAVKEMVEDTTELGQLRAIQSSSEKLSDIEKTIIEQRIKQLEEQKVTDERTFDTDIKKSYSSPIISSNDQPFSAQGENIDDLTDFLSSIKDPPIWRVL